MRSVRAFLPLIGGYSANATGIKFNWPAYPGMRYEVDYTPDLTQPFSAVANYIATGTNLNYYDPTPVLDNPQGFYLLRLLGFPGSGLLPPTAP